MKAFFVPTEGNPRVVELPESMSARIAKMAEYVGKKACPLPKIEVKKEFHHLTILLDDSDTSAVMNLLLMNLCNFGNVELGDALVIKEVDKEIVSLSEDDIKLIVARLKECESDNDEDLIE